jgi:DNA repair protein RecN (Recombination protein N)
MQDLADLAIQRWLSIIDVWHALHQRRVEMERNAQTYADELAELRDQVRELSQLSVSEEEWEELQQEHHRLSHAASLLAGGEAAVSS